MKIRRMLAVESDMITHVGFDPNTKTLVINFSNDKRYMYPSVADETYVQLLNAESIGAFFHKTIKPRISGVEMKDESTAAPKAKMKELPAREQLPLLDTLEPDKPDRRKR